MLIRRPTILVSILCLLLFTSCGISRKAPATRPDSNAQRDKELIEKYEGIIGQKIDMRINLPLYQAVDCWMGVPYKYGSNTRSGTDCSGFTGCIYRDVYKIELPRSSEDQYHKAKPVKRKDLEEGDLVFFRIDNKKKASHVGIYLGNNKFVHASTSKGVRIDDLESEYYKKYFVGGGRFENYP
jgi:murein DD-endopeptidase / murein LD-carboxypeptidase